MGQPIAFFEVVSPDHERAQSFYRELFDWQIAADPTMAATAWWTPEPASMPSVAASGRRRSPATPG